jgi:hypothetical protein
MAMKRNPGLSRPPGALVWLARAIVIAGLLAAAALR